MDVGKALACAISWCDDINAEAKDHAVNVTRNLVVSLTLFFAFAHEWDSPFGLTPCLSRTGSNRSARGGFHPRHVSAVLAPG